MRGEISLDCPKCQNIGSSGTIKKDKCFYNPEKNLWHCFLCDASGKGSPDDLMLDYDSYLQKRFGGNFPSEEFKLSYDASKNAVAIPILDIDGNEVGTKYRYLDPNADPRYTSKLGSKSGLYFLKGSEHETWLFVEGEFDAMAARSMGFKGHILAAQTNKVTAHLREQIDRLEPPKRILICEDQDEAGESLGSMIRQLNLKVADIANVHFKVQKIKDLSELLEHYRSEKAEEIFSQMLRSAKSTVDDITFAPLDRLDQVISYFENSMNTRAVPTAFQAFDTKLGGGIMPHTLIGLSAPGKTGKTTFIIQLISNMLKQNIKVGMISLEMNPVSHVIPSLLSILLQRNIRKMDASLLRGYLGENKANIAPLENMRIMDRYGVTDAALIDTWIRSQAAQGISIFFFDHVGYSLKDIKDPAEHSNLSKTLRAITRDLPVTIIAIVQPKGLQPGQKHVTKHDLYGSVTWSQDLNEIWTLERSNENELSLRVTDSHNPLAKPSEQAVLLFYDPETCSLSATTP